MASLAPPALTLFFVSFVLSFLAQHASASVLGHGSHHGSHHPDLVRALSPRETTATTSSTSQSDYTCSETVACSNGACCSSSGWCGYGDTYCGSECLSNCDATAECGENAAVAGTTCPLNTCCSQYGFCGTTDEFCGTGCQSDCDQPVPSAATSNTRSRIIGYWEAWNSDHACGTMSTGEIPAAMLTHLNVAFAYINADFEVTNMDGVSADIYKNVGNVKSKNPDLKLVISIGGWSFSDPGSYQAIFPTIVSSETNRATFITNLLSWLSEYGYDGVDFDWEYPGASDRGGSDGDGVNYTLFLKELRAAINASGKDYLVTFTAPTSYWYLQYFDLADMMEYVDWVNLMTYDLHGTWDSTDEWIGSQVLAHTNLTEIELALDLFWRVDVDPADIVLGLAFYGRTFQLSDASCWKPGCAFSSAGAAGDCTATAGILSYREIMQIIADTGATAYTDTDAAVKYLVYGDNSWVSYDDIDTFTTKINYADSMGLGGLMIWAIDLDDGSLGALSAVTNGAVSTSGVDFSLVPLEYLFPTDYLPADDAPTTYGLVTFGENTADGSMNPSQSGFGLMLLTGESYAVSSLKRRDDKPDPFIFLDCPSDVDQDKVHRARVVCMSDNLFGCFQVMQRGVEGTLVEMPDDCSPNTFARAISLTLSSDQQIPSDSLNGGIPTSEVYDFAFDFNIKLARRDTNSTSIRIDFSNHVDYWNGVVDVPGIQNRDLNAIKNRYFAPSTTEWSSQYDDTLAEQLGDNNYTHILKDISVPLFYSTTRADSCDVDGAEYQEGVAAYADGEIKADFYYGFTMIATILGDGVAEIDIQQTNGFLRPEGSISLTYGVGGVGSFDIANANKGNPAIIEGSQINLAGTSVMASQYNSIVLQPYYSVDYEIATFNGSEGESFGLSDAPFDGLLITKIVSDLGDMTINFPPTFDKTEIGPYSVERNANQISIPSDNVMYSTWGNGGKIAIGTYVTFGLKVDMWWKGAESNLAHEADPLVDFSVTYNTMTEFQFAPYGSETCVDYTISTQVYQEINKNLVNWEEYSGGELVVAYDNQSPTEDALCYAMVTSDTGLDRRISGGGGGLLNGRLLANTVATPTLLIQDYTSVFDDANPKVPCPSASACVGCAKDSSGQATCCGCICLICAYGVSDLEDCDECDPLMADEDWPGTSVSQLKRDLQSSRLSETGPTVQVSNKEQLSTRTSSDPRGHDDDDDDDEDLNGTTPVYDNDEEEDEFTSPNPYYNVLQARAKATIGKSRKAVKFCRDYTPKLPVPFKYPQFPNDVTKDFDTADQGKWDSISKYWGNASFFCGDWSIDQVNPADTVLYNSKSIRTAYQTEHVLEGQLIGDFFKVWLPDGKVTNQNQNVQLTTKAFVSCTWTEKYIQTASIKSWTLPGTKLSVALADLLVSELGSEKYMDRLAILQTRPNGMKGRLFSGKRGIDPSSATAWGSKDAEAQLMTLKDLGMAFTYLRNDDIWDKFCVTFEAIYDDLVDFDTWYASQSGVPALGTTLAEEWGVYVRATLDSISLNSKTLVTSLLLAAASGASNGVNVNTATAWLNVIGRNKAMMAFPGKCTHLDGPTV